MGVEDGGNGGVRTAQREKLRAARKLLKITEKGLGAENAEDSDALLDELSARQDAINELLAADKKLKEFAEEREAAGSRQPEVLSLAAETDAVLQKVQELYREDTEEAQDRMDLYQNKILQLRARKKTLEAFPKDSGDVEGSNFEARG